MCGIVGIAGKRRIVSEEMLAAMRDTMAHRGPDDAGLYSTPDGAVRLGHRRLAIIDLSAAGHQPMTDEREDLVLVFNGEIYNFQLLRERLAGSYAFRSACDSEVILAAYRRWGDACLEHLDGMFSLCLLDRSRNRLLLARDRAGEKPLFYRHAGGVFWFASELKALMACPQFPRELDAEALNHYLAFGHISGETCILGGTSKLPPGTAASYDIETDKLRTWPYWQLPREVAPGEADVDELADRFHELLRQSLRTRLVADVPVGVLLSGGIDSSLVTAVAAEVSPNPLRTFTVSFPGYGDYDEAPHARKVAEHFGTEHVELAAEDASVELLEMLAEQYDEPMGDSSMVPTFIVCREIRRQATVALGGDGGDELFGGYQVHMALLRLARLRRMLPKRLRRPLHAMVRAAIPDGRMKRRGLLGLLADGPQSVLELTTYWQLPDRRKLMSRVWDRVGRPDAPEALKLASQGTDGSVLRRVTASDFRTYLPEDILTKVDRASMRTSLEVRSPLLSPAIIEFAFSAVPDHLRATGREGKILPRHLARRLLPSGLDLNRKQGFSLPLDQWFSGRWGRFIASVLSEADESLFDRSVIQRALRGQHRGARNLFRLFPLTMFELWRRRYNVSLPAAGDRA